MPIQPSSTTIPPSSQFRHNTPPPIPSSSTNLQWVAGAPKPPPASTKPNSWRPPPPHHVPSPVPSPSQSKNAGSPALSNISYSSTPKITIPLPTLTSNNFPQTLVINPKQLAKYLMQKENPPSILLMDVRPREEFENGCIRHKYVIQIEPLTLRSGYVHTRFSSSISRKQYWPEIWLAYNTCFYKRRKKIKTADFLIIISFPNAFVLYHGTALLPAKSNLLSI